MVSLDYPENSSTFPDFHDLIPCLIQDAQDAFLEQERDRILTKKLVTIQKVIRGWHYRRKFKKMKMCCVVIQAMWRGYSQRIKYEQVRSEQIKI